MEVTMSNKFLTITTLKNLQKHNLHVSEVIFLNHTNYIVKYHIYTTSYYKGYDLITRSIIRSNSNLDINTIIEQINKTQNELDKFVSDTSTNIDFLVRQFKYMYFKNHTKPVLDYRYGITKVINSLLKDGLSHLDILKHISTIKPLQWITLLPTTMKAKK